MDRRVEIITEVSQKLCPKLNSKFTDSKSLRFNLTQALDDQKLSSPISRKTSETFQPLGFI